MIFKNQQHKDFFTLQLNRASADDAYHRTFFYTVGLNKDTRNHLEDIFDFQEKSIKPEGLNCSWQTSGSRCITLMAFNLWNGFVEQDHERDSTPDNLFACSDAVYFFEALRIRYPEYCGLTGRTEYVK